MEKIIRRRLTQSSFTIWAENDFWSLLNAALSSQRRLNKSQFIRDAIAEKMGRDFGIQVPDELIVPLPPHTQPIAIKNAQDKIKKISSSYSVKFSKEGQQVAEDPQSYGKKTAKKTPKKKQK